MSGNCFSFWERPPDPYRGFASGVTPLGTSVPHTFWAIVPRNKKFPEPLLNTFPRVTIWLSRNSQHFPDPFTGGEGTRATLSFRTSPPFSALRPSILGLLGLTTACLPTSLYQNPLGAIVSSYLWQLVVMFHLRRLFPEQDYAPSFQAIFTKLFWIVDHCYGKNDSNLGWIPLTVAEWQPFFDFCYNIFM